MWNTIQLFSKKFFDCLSTTFTKTLFNVAQFTWVSYILHFSSVCNVCIVIGFWVSKYWTPAKRISSLGCHDLLLLTNCLSVFDHFVGLALKACKTHLNPFHVILSFLYPLKTSDKLWFSDDFSGYSSRTLEWNW